MSVKLALSISYRLIFTVAFLLRMRFFRAVNMTQLTFHNGMALLKAKKFEQVHKLAIAAIKANVRDPLPYFMLGKIAAEHDNLIKADQLFAKSVTYNPGDVYAVAHHAKTLSALAQHNSAKAQADRAVEIGVEDAYLADTLGVVYSRAGYHKLAMPLFAHAVDRHPDHANLQYNLASSAQFTGDFDTARDGYRKTIALEHDNYRAWTSLVSLDTQTNEQNMLDDLISLFDGAGDNAEAKLQLGHAIAKTLEDLGRHEDSLKWLIKGKTVKRDELRYNRDTGAKLFASARKTYPEDNKLSHSARIEHPIFIVGLPRTGTTLVDRIISSHSKVVSAGELSIFSELTKITSKSPSNLAMDSETFDIAANFSSDTLSEIGQSYLEAAKDRAQNSSFMVDKMPLNCFYSGLIHRALPNARIIALRRGAMDSCLSNFRQLFATQYSYYNYTLDLEDTAWFYRQFDSLMTHWRTVLPSDRFMEVCYEDIIFDQENQTRRLLDFCGLDWEDACMRFHENAAPVATASSVQVRQPLYSGSIGRWKKYGDKLNGLKTALGDLAD